MKFTAHRTMWNGIFGNDYNIALLLDVDGTLLEIADAPEAVRVPPELPEILDELATRLNGALALVSGRSLEELDRLFYPYRFCAAGMHGCEVREASGLVRRAPLDALTVGAVYDECREFSAEFAGVVIEHKTHGIAIHYRLAPDMRDRVHHFAEALVARQRSGFTVQPGKCVCEIKPTEYSKGTAILALAASMPFSGRRPVFIGDDLADEAGFRAVNSLGGVSIRVGAEAPTLAHRTIEGPADVHRLLARLLVGLATLPLPLRATS